jgi:GntR family transcriptional regulator, transcriptional repressor for pyruvate dehydrogenase complex
MSRVAEPNSDTLANNIAFAIRRQIISEDLAHGDFFRTEGDLADQFSVSRNVLREAISRLRGLGILKSRQKKGLIVGDPSLADLVSLGLPFYARRADRFRQVCQMRYALEIGSIELAVANATERDVRHLKASAERFEEAVRRGNAKGVDAADLSFHLLLLSMTHNDLIAGMHRVLSDFFSEAGVNLPAWNEPVPNTVGQHHAISAAIARRDVRRAHAILRQHLASLRDARTDS